MSNWNIKRYLSLCGGLILSISVCGLIWNEYILIKKQLELMSTWLSSYSCQYAVVNMWFLLYLCMDTDSKKSLLLYPLTSCTVYQWVDPVNIIQGRINWNCWAFNPSSVFSQYVVVWLFLHQYAYTIRNMENTAFSQCNGIKNQTSTKASKYYHILPVNLLEILISNVLISNLFQTVKLPPK